MGKAWNRTMAQSLVDLWNERYPEGTPILYWRYPGQNIRSSVTKTKAKVVGRVAVVWIKGRAGAWPLINVDPIEDRHDLEVY